MDARRALEILSMTHFNSQKRGWMIPIQIKRCQKNIITNGKMAELVYEDEVTDFLKYVKQLLMEKNKNEKRI